MLLLLCMVFRKVIFSKWLKESEAISETAAKATETITAFHTKSRLFLSLGHSRNKNKWGKIYTELQVEWALWSVLKMKRVNKKEPKGSGLHRFNKAFLCSIEFCTFFLF